MDSMMLGRVTGLLNRAVSVAGRGDKGPLYPHARVMVAKGGKVVYDEMAVADGFKCEKDSIYGWASQVRPLRQPTLVTHRQPRHPDILTRRADPAPRAPVQTKLLAAVAVMQCYEQGLLSITDPVSKFIPCFRKTEVFVDAESADAPEAFKAMGIMKIPVNARTVPQDTPMTIKHLLTHTSGLGYGGFTMARGGCHDDVDLLYMMGGVPASTFTGGMFGVDEKYASLEVRAAGCRPTSSSAPAVAFPSPRWASARPSVDPSVLPSPALTRPSAFACEEPS